MSQDLWSAVDGLTNPRRERVDRDNGRGEWITLPSLFDQLTEAVQSGPGSGGHGRQGSRPPLDVECVSLLLDIAGAVADACRGLELKRTFDTPEDLRSVVSRLIREPDSGDEQDWWVTQIRAWCGQIRATISSDPDRPWELHDVPCPECGARTTHSNNDTERVRRPAITVWWSRGYVRAVECRVCTAVWYRGTDLETLVERMLQTQKPSQPGGKISA